jgi:hypothetical protein
MREHEGRFQLQTHRGEEHEGFVSSIGTPEKMKEWQNLFERVKPDSQRKIITILNLLDKGDNMSQQQPQPQQQPKPPRKGCGCGGGKK